MKVVELQILPALQTLSEFTLEIFEREHPEHPLSKYLSMSYDTLIKDDILAEFLEELSLKYIIFDPESKQIIQWIR
jgi:hypothetical protein